mgnify:CR=1 FL=1
MIEYDKFDLYMEESVDKQLQIAFDGGTITNKEIPSEQFSLTESLSSDGLMFGSCEASEIKFRIYNVFTPLKDKWLTVTQVLDKDYDNPLQIGKYKVYSDKPTADRSYRDVVAYDSMFDIINADVASWYNSLTFPMQLKTFRDSFFDYFGIDQEEVALVNDAMTVEKTIEPSVLSGKDVLQSICQINGCFGHIGRDGKMQYVFLNAIMGGLYPSNNIYPAYDLYPMRPNINVLSKGLYVEPPTYEDYMVKPIDKLEIREKEGDIGVIVGSGNNAYVVEDNFLVYGKSTDDLTVIANNMLSVIDGLEYRPFDARLVGNPCFEVGDMVRLNTKHQIIDSYVLQRTLSGVQCLRDDFSAEGEEYQSEKVNDIQTDIKQLKGKSNTLERTVEETRSTIADVEKGLSEITQTADAIRLEVADNTGKISTIEQDIDSITQTVEDNKKELSSRIDQTVSNISLTVNNGDSTAGIVITLINEDGSTSEVTGTIDMTGLVTFTDLLTQGQTVINGSNITTGQINCDLLNGGTINGQVYHSETTDYTVDIRNGKIKTTLLYLIEPKSTGGYIPGIVKLNSDQSEVTNAIHFYDDETVIEKQLFITSGSGGTSTVYPYCSIYGAGRAYFDGAICPDGDEEHPCGSDGYKWSQVYAKKDTINTSDKNKKNNINPISDKYEQLFFEIKPVTYMFNNGDRVHIGAISQDVEESMKSLEISDIEFAGFCKDVKKKSHIDENGKCIEIVDLDENGNEQYNYGLRYGEFIMLNTHMIQKAYKKIETQQQEIEELKKSVSFLMKEIERLGGNNE